MRMRWVGGQSRDILETRNGNDLLVSQQVWDNLAGHYVDSLLEIGHDINGSGEVDRRFYALTDTLYNVLAITDTHGNIAERYEYTPYGKRSVFRSSEFIVSNADFDGDSDVDNADLSNANGNYTGSGGSGKTFADGDTDGDGDVDNADIGVISGEWTGSIVWPDAQTPVTPADASLQLHTGVNLCDFGHQGLMHDETVGQVYNRARFRSPTFGRFMQRDPHPDIYPDGMNAYASYHLIQHGGFDPLGLEESDGKTVFDVSAKLTGAILNLRRVKEGAPISVPLIATSVPEVMGEKIAEVAWDVIVDKLFEFLGGPRASKMNTAASRIKFIMGAGTELLFRDFTVEYNATASYKRQTTCKPLWATAPGVWLLLDKSPNTDFIRTVTRSVKVSFESGEYPIGLAGSGRVDSPLFLWDDVGRFNPSAERGISDGFTKTLAELDGEVWSEIWRSEGVPEPKRRSTIKWE